MQKTFRLLRSRVIPEDFPHQQTYTKECGLVDLTFSRLCQGQEANHILEWHFGEWHEGGGVE